MQAAFRGATAASRLGEFDRAEALCNQGLASSQEDADLLKLREVTLLGMILKTHWCQIVRSFCSMPEVLKDKRIVCLGHNPAASDLGCFIGRFKHKDVVV